jgi:hypothetical protein
MQLNLPAQGAIDRLREPYEPFLVKLGEDIGDDGKPFVVMAKPGGDHGPLPGDPRALQCLDARGWHCAPVAGCVWRGLV